MSTLALGAAEVKLLLRNRTAAISSLFLRPTALARAQADAHVRAVRRRGVDGDDRPGRRDRRRVPGALRDRGRGARHAVPGRSVAAAAFALPTAPLDSWWQALVLVPGAPIGQLATLAFTGGTFAPGLLGLPVLLPALVSSVVWPIVFAILARRYFRWDPRV